MSHKEGGERESEGEREHTNEGGSTVWLKEKAKEKEERKENEKVSGLLKEVVISCAGRCNRERSS